MTLFTFLLSTWALVWRFLSFLFFDLLSFLARLPVVAESDLLCFETTRGRLFVFVTESGLFSFMAARGRVNIVFIETLGHFCAQGFWWVCLWINFFGVIRLCRVELPLHWCLVGNSVGFADAFSSFRSSGSLSVFL